MAELRLVGHAPSIYAWILRLVLSELGRAAVFEEVDPFARPVPERLRALNPAGKVPVLVEGDFVLTETRAICLYLAEGSALIPEDRRARARMHEVVAMLDAEGYWPLVRQVYGQWVFAPHEGAARDPRIVAEGLRRGETVLDRLEALAPGETLLGGAQSLADCHAAPMIHALTRHPEGAALVAARPGLARWLEAQRARPAFAATRPPAPA